MKEHISMRKILSVYWRHVRPYKGLAFLIGGSIFLSESIHLLYPWFMKEFFDVLTAPGASTDPTTIALLMNIVISILILHLVTWVLYRVANLTTSHFVPRVMADIEQNGFSYLLGHSYTFFTNTFAGSLVRKVRRLSQAFDNMQEVVFYNFIQLFVVIFGTLIALSFRSIEISLAILVWIILLVVLNVSISRWKLKYDERRAEMDSEVTAALADSVSNSINIKLFGGVAHENKLFKTITEAYKKLQTFTWNLAEINEAAQILLVILVEVAVLWIGVKLWTAGSLTIGDFALFQGYLGILFSKMWSIGRIIRRAYEAMADAKQMVEILHTPYEVQDSKSAKSLQVTKGEIVFEQVEFCYHKTRCVLDDFDLKIAPGEKIALVGPSGAGKSTVVKLLFRFHDIQNGKILIDGQKISQVTQESLRDQISLVPQEPILFHRTLMDNIRYGRRDATDEEIIEASKKARCHEFIRDFPDGYETFVGERGVKLSGGERQRVAIARAILKNAPILVLDEATSSLDSESEHLIQEALHELMKGKTTIVIAHRLSTILEMDRIVVVEGGKVADQGTHKELLKKKGLYKKLWEIQAGGFLQ